MYDDPNVIAAVKQLPLASLDELREKFRGKGDVAGVALVDLALEGKQAVQTSELSQCGQLFRHKIVDDYSGQTKHVFTGDIAEFMRPFVLADPMTGRFDPDLQRDNLRNAQIAEHGRLAEVGRAAEAASRAKQNGKDYQ